MSKTELHPDVSLFIKTKAKSAGQLYKVLENGQYYIETTNKHRGTLKRLRSYLQSEASAKNTTVDLLQTQTRVIADCDIWLDLFYDKDQQGNHLTGYSTYPYDRKIVKVTLSRPQTSSVVSTISGTLQLNNVNDLKRGDVVVYQVKTNSDDLIINNMTVDTSYFIKDVYPTTKTITLCPMIHFNTNHSNNSNNNRNNNNTQQKYKKIDNQTTVLQFDTDIYSKDLKFSRLSIFNSERKSIRGTVGYNDVRNKMNVSTWNTRWKEQHRTKLLQQQGWSNNQQRELNKKEIEMKTQLQKMWEKIGVVLRNIGQNGMNLYNKLIQDEFMLEEPWQTPNAGIQWRSCLKRTYWLTYEDRKKNNTWKRMRDHEKRMSFKRKKDTTSMVASSTENGRMISIVMKELKKEGTTTISDLDELTQLTQEVLRYSDIVEEEKKINLKKVKIVNQTLEQLENKNTFKTIWLRENYDFEISNLEWKSKIDNKITQKLKMKGDALQHSKTVALEQKWEGSRDHDNFIVLQKMQRGQVTEEFNEMMSSVEDRLNFAEHTENVVMEMNKEEEFISHHTNNASSGSSSGTSSGTSGTSGNQAHLLTTTTRLRYPFKQEQIEDVLNWSQANDTPLVDEYAYLQDKNDVVKMSLKQHVKIRDYQSKALERMFSNSRARSGVIVLPCGSGKTLVGITAAVTMKKSCLCLVTGGVSAEQWKSQFIFFSTVNPNHVCRFTGTVKDPLPKDGTPVILVTTYSMLSFGGHRSRENELYMEDIKRRTWGLLLLDEVHVVPAQTFRKTVSIVRCHTKLGLTATLVREDGKVDQISYLIGPKMYEANWMNLTARGYLAKVLCSEVWCPMTTEFYREYLDPRNVSRKTTSKGSEKKKLTKFRAQQRLFVMNPNKVAACRQLVNSHLARKDKILVFSDDIFALKQYARLLGVPMLYGSTSAQDRLSILTSFKTSTTTNVICISSVGDTSIDLPECTVIIQVASHFGARRQEAQRLGRVLRPKPGVRIHDGYNAYFYTLVSTETREMFFANKRQRYLTDQGYTYKVLTRLLDWEAGARMTARGDTEGNTEPFMSRNQQQHLLAKMIDDAVTKDDVNRRGRRNVTENDDYDLMDVDDDQEGGEDWDDVATSSSSNTSSTSSSSRSRNSINSSASYTARRTEGSGFGAATGANDIAYAEVEQGRKKKGRKNV